jgi:HD-GYP domain-containing protein (c-di-GMP phosphodiesterase class II)
MDKKQIPVGQLRQGMYVVALDRPWLGTPFLFQGFSITDNEQIEALKKLCQHVIVDLERDGRPAPPVRRAPAISTGRRVEYSDTTSFEQELVVAKEIYTVFVKTVESCLAVLQSTGEIDLAPLAGAVSSMNESIKRNPNAMMLLIRIQEKGSYEINRAVDTSVLMITFGRFLQYPPERLELLGLAGLLLDVGKVRVPDGVLRKPGLLDPAEYELAKGHVMHSVDLLRKCSGLPAGLEAIVLQHHERQDGGGYPLKLHGEDISIDGAMAGLVDSFSALTSARPYAEQLSPSNALGQLYKLRGKLFHGALTEQFIQCIGIYPVGSVVELNTGEIGIVIAQNLVRRLQPRVMVVLDRDWKPLPTQLVLDLMKEPRATSNEPYRIRRTLPKDKLPLDPRDFFL